MKKKLTLKELKVQSFSTSTDKDLTKAQGGSHYTVWCPSQWGECDRTDLC